MSRLSLAAVLVVLSFGCHKKTSKPEDAGLGSATAVDPSELAGTLDKKCVAGDLEACRLLGVMYQEGTGVSPDPRRATALFAQGCTGNNLSACNNLGMNLADGLGVDKNPTKAIDAYTKACDGGMKLACRNLGLLYRDGRGVPQDLAKAEPLLDKACKTNTPYACKNAGDLDLMLSEKGAPHWKQAVAHYKTGCDNGDQTSCRAIGVMYLDGRAGLPKSTSAAAVWLERACLQDDPIGCRVLGMMLVQGVGVTKDLDRGKQLLTRACGAHDEDACRALDGSGAGSATPNDQTSAGSGSGSGSNAS